MSGFVGRVVKAIGNALFYEFYNYEGRASRFEYFSFWLFHWLVLGAVVSIISISHLDNVLANVILIIVGVVLKLALLAVTARRLHDSNLSSYWLGFYFVPVVGWLIVLVLMFRQGNDSTNHFGQKPLV